MSPDAVASKIEWLSIQCIQKIQKHNLTGLEKMDCENRFATQKYNLMIQNNIIKKDGWFPET